MTDTTPSDPIELDGERFRALTQQALDRIVPFLDSLATQPTFDSSRNDEFGDEPTIAEEGVPFPRILDDLFGRRIPPGFNTAGPGYLAFIPGGGIPASAIAELIANSVNRYVGVFAAAPGLASLEAGVIQWFCREVGLPAGAGGLLTSGGSLANWTALVTARQRLGERYTDGVIYTSDQAHHSIAKAAHLAGYLPRNVRSIQTDDLYRIDVEALNQAIARDREDGLLPAAIVSNGGSTNTGAVDDLVALDEIARREQLWHHVDAAYGGFFTLTQRGKEALRGIDRADSVTLDPHKGLFLPYGTGCLLVKRQADLRRAHQTFADYMPAMQHDEARVDYCDISPELSRDFRGLRVWLPLMLHGAKAFRDQLDEKLDLALLATERLRAIPSIEILAAPQLSTVAFRALPTGPHADAHAAQIDAWNEELLARINARQRAFLTATRLRGRFAIRISVLSFRTHRERIDAVIEDIEAGLKEMVTTPS